MFDSPPAVEEESGRAWCRLEMVYSLVAVAVAVAAIMGAWGLTKEALRESEPES